MDRFSPLAPAFIRVLLLPVGQISTTRFADLARRLQTEASIIKLSELVSDDARLASFAPSIFQYGELFFNYTTTVTREDPQHIAPFELFRKPSLVLGILDGSQGSLDQQGDALKHAAAYLRERHPRVVYRQLLTLQDGPTASDGDLPNALTILNASSPEDPSLVSVVQQLSIQYLIELATYAKAVEATPSVQTPGQTARSLQRTLSLIDERRPNSPLEKQARSSNDTAIASRPSSRNHASPPHATSFEQTPNVTDQSNGPSRSESPRSKDNQRATAQDRVSMHGFGPSTSQDKARARGKARVGIVTGHIHLMAGQWNEALRLLIEHTNRARMLSDHIWNGKGLEGIMVALMLIARSGLSFAIPSICYAVSEKGSRHLSRSSLAEEVRSDDGNTASRRRLASAVPDMVKQIISLFKIGDGPLELPLVVLADARIRFCKLLAVLQYSTGDLNRRNLQAFIDDKFDFEVTAHNSIARAELSRRSISEIIDEALPCSNDQMEPGERIAILSGIASVYSLLGMPRKKGLVMKDIIAILSATMAQARRLGAAEAGIHPTASLVTESGATSESAMAEESSGLADLMAELTRIYRVEFGGNNDVETTIRSAVLYSSGNLNLKTQILRDLMTLCEVAPDFQGVSRLASSLLAISRPPGIASVEDAPSITATRREESERLSSVVERVSAMSKHSALKQLHVSYVDPFLVRGIEFGVRQPETDVIQRRQSKNNQELPDRSASSNPLLYDRNSSRPGTALPRSELLVQNEPVDLLLTLQNPFQAPIEIRAIEYVVEGVEGHTEASPLTLLPSSLNKVATRFTPNTHGDFKMVGCRIHVTGFTPQSFSIFPQPWAATSSGLLKDLGHKTERFIEDPRPGMKASKPEAIVLHGKVIPAQPTLEITFARELESHLMLLDGEMTRVKIMAKNTSPVIATVLEAKGTANVLRFTVETDTRHQIEPGKTCVFELEITGRAGTSRARANLYYTSSTTAEVGEYSRVVSATVETTVHGALRIPHADTMLLQTDREFMLSFDIGNVWPQPLTFTCFSRADGDDGDLLSAAEGTLGPGEFQRLHLPMKFGRSSTMSCQVEDLRANLLRRLKISWCGDGRSGIVDLGKLPLSSATLERTRAPPIEAHARVVDDDLNDTSAVPIGQFVNVRVSLKNTTADRTKVLAVELLARTRADMTLDERYVIMTGPQQRLVPPLLPGRESTVDFVICPLLHAHIQLQVMVKPADMEEYPLSISDTWQAVCTTEVLVRSVDPPAHPTGGARVAAVSAA